MKVCTILTPLCDPKGYENRWTHAGRVILTALKLAREQFILALALKYHAGMLCILLFNLKDLSSFKIST